MADFKEDFTLEIMLQQPLRQTIGILKDCIELFAHIQETSVKIKSVYPDFCSRLGSSNLGAMMQERPCMRRIVPCSEDDSNTPELWEGETIDYCLDDVEINFSAEKPPVGVGKLFVTSKRVIWLGRDESAFDFDVPYIALHAVTRDADSYPKPCVYCQLDVDEECNDEGSDDEEASDETPDEMFLIPSCEENLSDIFSALSAAALNNPDPPEEWEQEGDDELIYNSEEVELGAEQARTLAHLESVFCVPEGYGEAFEEGDEEGDEGEGGADGQYDDA